ncbi:uncharacterized protein L3040_008750 [Drepanopeziza brunnea f. sp. 'multigermtubi']|uniref:Uncharacterized protein n=1 Tax=Marssonina brunnea f. sp. multigermtubi (strain MB_m1) TaxID=1072389 RepID=K1X0P7_MARBU|nr:uncharacterized protein MBM_02988 [Drepanopeziza brunnea f. sp. 'multigermtubi' MB_m1]EKD18746.1 hypothetical protein MBM_02988 [Drepanopeziza brunnea f. sp. 'multigermtubi' MB_m1]KAJ5033638.1 hypothetical protein L3040_008750 [Drepanopeziza brunnea f. sp. 'multigermtubi']
MSAAVPGNPDTGRNQEITSLPAVISAPTTASSFPATSSSAVATSKSALLKMGDTHALIIGTVTGGVGALILICVVTLCFVNRRKKQRKEKKAGAEPVSYIGVNQAFAGVPFRQSQLSSQLSPRPLLQAYPNSALSPGLRSDKQWPSFRDNERDDIADQYFASPLPSPAHPPDSSRDHASVQARSHFEKPTNIGRHSRSNSTGSQLTLHDLSEAHVLSVHGPLSPGFQLPDFEFQSQRDTMGTQRDTMGFPIDAPQPIVPNPGQTQLNSMTPVLLAPKPLHPPTSQDPLERVVRDRTLTSSPAPSISASDRVRVLSTEFRQDSPILGMQGSQVVIRESAAPRVPSGLGFGLGADDTRTTVSYISTMSPVVRDGELESPRMGARPQPLQIKPYQDAI